MSVFLLIMSARVIRVTGHFYYRSSRFFLSSPRCAIRGIGDGEWALSDIAANVMKNEDPSQVLGIVTLHSSRFLPRFLVTDLDSFPPPARNLATYTHQQYKLAKRRQFEAVNRISLPQYQNLPTATMMTSRGCVYSCAFCGTERGRRVHSVERVLEELGSCTEAGIRYIVFFDDLFIGPSKVEMTRSASICKGIIKGNMQIYWEIEERADILARLSVEYIQLMFDAGLRIINIGFEKPTNESLKLMKKGQKTIDAYAAVEKLRRVSRGNITINGNFILGGLGETEDDCMKTIAFAQSLGIDHATFNILEIYPGAPLWHQINGVIEDNSLLNFENTQYYRSELLPVPKLLQLQRYAYQSFYAPNFALLNQHDTAKHL